MVSVVLAEVGKGNFLRTPYPDEPPPSSHDLIPGLSMGENDQAFGLSWH